MSSNTSARSAPQVVLASASPRRRQLLAAMTPDFRVAPADVDEARQGDETPGQMVRRLSLAKAHAAADLLSAREEPPTGGWLVIAADTIVVDGQPHGAILGKPADAGEARQMLRRLRDRRHWVYSGLAILAIQDNGAPHDAASPPTVACTPVIMRAYDDDELERYVASGDPLDKAGAYAVQHTDFRPIARLEGCYTNVVGLPMCHLYGALPAACRSAWRHPLESCPYAREHTGCPWAAAILAALL
ncbi:MAG: Maf family protein [Chloroflexota bacterium]